MSASTRLSTGLLALLCALTLTFASRAQASLLSRAGGQAYYDDVANLTWVTNPSPLGQDYWMPQKSWAESLTIDGVGGWGFPSLSEMQFLYTSDGVSAASSSPLNLDPSGGAYWSSTSTGTSTGVYGFYFGDGTYTGYNIQNNRLWALAAQSGDVLSVPEPTTIALFGVGLAGLGFSRRKRIG